MISKRKIGVIIVLSVLFAPLIVLAAASITLTPISPNLPGSLSNVSSPGAWVVSFYNYALFLSGLLAFGAMVYGGIRYSWARGNSAGESDAKQWIWSALLGLLLLVSAYIILYTVNPNLVNLQLPSLGGAVTPTAQTGGGGGGGGVSGGTQAVTGNCASGQCQTLPNCTVAAKTNCGGAQGMVNTLNCVSSKDPNYSVNEGYPPTVSHESQCHNNGCCVDVHVSNCAGAAAAVAAAQQCGATAVNEYAQCAGSKIFNSTTGGNVHINAQKGQGGC